MKRLLFIESDDYAFRSISSLLEDIGYSQDRINRYDKAGKSTAINAEEIEIVLIGLSSQDPSCMDSLQELLNLFPRIPVIVLINTAETDLAIKSIQEGAQDYLVKGDFDQRILKKAIQTAIEQKKRLNRLFIEKRDFKAIINNTKDLMWSIDKEYKIISANDAFWEYIYLMTNKRPDEVHKEDFEKELLDTWINYFKRAFNDEVFKIIWKDTNNGRDTYREVSFNPIYNKRKIIIGASCFSRDITEQIIYLKMIETQNDKLSKIAWVQSHEVRGPLATILGLTELLKPEDSYNAEILTHLKVAANNLDDVIKRITSYTHTVTD